MRHICILIAVIALTSCKSAGKNLGKGLLEGMGQAIGTTVVDTISKSNQQQNQPPSSDSLQNQPSSSDLSQNQSLEDVLLQIASETNKSLPMKIDKETLLTNVDAYDNTLVYSYMLVNYSYREVNFNKFMPTVRQMTTNAVCSDPDTKALLNEGGSYNFRYSGNDNTFIGQFLVSKSNCYYM